MVDQNSVHCLGCGLVCEDAIQVDDHSIEPAEAIECSKRDDWVRQQNVTARNCNIAGKPCSMDDAITEIAEILAQAKAPLYCGFSNLLIENQRRVVQLARETGGYLDWTTSSHQVDAVLSLQRKGHVGCSLGEVKNRADLVIYWDLDVAQSAPRFCERFLRTDKVVSINSTTEHGVERAKLVLTEDRMKWLNSLRLGVDGLVGESVSAELAQQADELIQQIKLANYCVIVIHSVDSRIGCVEHEQLTQLIMELNRHTQVRLIDLAQDNNSRGAENVMAWLTGFPMTIRSDSTGAVVYDPNAYSTQDLLDRRLADLICVIGGTPADVDHGAANKVVPRIEIGSCRSDATRCNVQIPLVSDFLTKGTVVRCDGMPLHQSGCGHTVTSVSQVIDSLLTQIRERR